MQTEDYVWKKYPKNLITVERNSTKSSFLFIDLDDFKNINDKYGHDHGDIVLQDVALKIKKEIRSFDLAGRLGGDEFMVIIRGSSDSTY